MIISHNNNAIQYYMHSHWKLKTMSCTSVTCFYHSFLFLPEHFKDQECFSSRTDCFSWYQSKKGVSYVGESKQFSEKRVDNYFKLYPCFQHQERNNRLNT